MFLLINAINKTGRIKRSDNRDNIIKITEYSPMVDIVGNNVSDDTQATQRRIYSILYH